MVWQVAVIVDPSFEATLADTLSRYMPLWMVDTTSNIACVQAARKATNQTWFPQPVCTSFRVTDPEDRQSNLLNIVNVVELHHFNLAKMNIFGLAFSPELEAELEPLDFVRATSMWESSVAFRKPIDLLKGVPDLHLDASEWKTASDVYSGLLEEVGAPEWHGRNFDALHDSIVTGGISKIEVPYKLTIRGSKQAGPEARAFLNDLANLSTGFEREGCPISLRLD